MLFSRLRTASSLVSDCVMAINRRSMSACSAVNAMEKLQRLELSKGYVELLKEADELR
jgi:hypothetical protein